MPIRHTSIKEVRRDRLKGYMDRRFIQAIGHPVREHILAVLNERPASPTEIGDELELDVSAFYKHVQLLEELGCIECVATRCVRGVEERILRAKESFCLDSSSWAEIPASLRADITAELLRLALNDAVRALEAGTMDARADRHVSWTPGFVDQQGWAEVVAILGGALARVRAVQEGSAARLVEDGEEGIPVTVAILGYEAEWGGGSRPPEAV